jgi:hypothetical protein
VTKADSLVCVECGAVADATAYGWRMYLTDDDPPSPASFCPECAEAEF